jgi:hypothetical protein
VGVPFVVFTKHPGGSRLLCNSLLDASLTPIRFITSEHLSELLTCSNPGAQVELPTLVENTEGSEIRPSLHEEKLQEPSASVTYDAAMSVGFPLGLHESPALDSLSGTQRPPLSSVYTRFGLPPCAGWQFKKSSGKSSNDAGVALNPRMPQSIVTF